VTATETCTPPPAGPSSPAGPGGPGDDDDEFVAIITTGRNGEVWKHVTRVRDGVATSWSERIDLPEVTEAPTTGGEH
jgi:hypothetical protein